MSTPCAGAKKYIDKILETSVRRRSKGDADKEIQEVETSRSFARAKKKKEYSKSSDLSSVEPSRPLEINGIDVDEVPLGGKRPAEGIVSRRAGNDNRSGTATKLSQPTRTRTRDTIDLDNERGNVSNVRRSERQKRRTCGAAFNVQQEDRRNRERNSSEVKVATGQQRQPKGNTSIIDLDPEEAIDEASSDQNSPATEPVTKRTRSTSPAEVPRARCVTRSHKNAPNYLELDEQDEAKEELKSLNAVDAPYDGPTHIIFKYPPGERGKITVTAEERERLKHRKYLNDSLIDFYLKYLESTWNQNPRNARRRAKFFSSFFFGVLRRSKPIDYIGVKNWTKGIDLFATQFIFVPICDSYHWSLVIVANLNILEETLKKQAQSGEQVEFKDASSAPRIIYLDSLDPKRGLDFAHTMRRYLVEEWICRKERKQSDPDMSEMTLGRFKRALPTFKPNVPIQNNEYDCGLYLLNTLSMFLNNLDDFQEKVLSGERNVVRDAYNHIDIQKLRKEIIILMDCQEKAWNVDTEEKKPSPLSSSGLPLPNTALSQLETSSKDGSPAAKMPQLHASSDIPDVNANASMSPQNTIMGGVQLNADDSGQKPQVTNDSVRISPEAMDIDDAALRNEHIQADANMMEVGSFPQSGHKQSSAFESENCYGTDGTNTGREIYDVDSGNPPSGLRPAGKPNPNTEERKVTGAHIASSWQGNQDEGGSDNESAVNWVDGSRSHGDRTNIQMTIQGLHSNLGAEEGGKEQETLLRRKSELAGEPASRPRSGKPSLWKAKTMTPCLAQSYARMSDEPQCVDVDGEDAGVSVMDSTIDDLAEPGIVETLKTPAKRGECDDGSSEEVLAVVDN